MEIVISDGIVSASTEQVDSPAATVARRIANCLPRPELLEGARIVHNEDEGYTAIAFDAAAGVIEVWLPVAAGFEFQVVHQADQGPRIIGPLNRVGITSAPRAVANQISEFLRLKALK